MMVVPQRMTMVMVVLLLVGGNQFFHLQLEAMQKERPTLKRFTYLPEGEILKVVSLGYQQLFADLLWLRVIQAMGDRKVSTETGHWIYRALDIVTTLDHKFVRAYEAGGLALVTLVVLPHESNRLLEKGMKHNPREWKLPFLIGINYFFELYDDAKAAEYIERASRLPEAPAVLGRLAARLYVSGKDPQRGVELLAQLYQQTTDEPVRQVLAKRLKLFIVERDLSLFDQAIIRYQQVHGRTPNRLEDLVGPSLLRALPQEPFGGRYIYDPKTLQVKSSEQPDAMRHSFKRRAR